MEALVRQGYSIAARLKPIEAQYLMQIVRTKFTSAISLLRYLSKSGRLTEVTEKEFKPIFDGILGRAREIYEDANRLIEVGETAAAVDMLVPIIKDITIFLDYIMKATKGKVSPQQVKVI